jgi:hypothetical protein
MMSGPQSDTKTAGTLQRCLEDLEARIDPAEEDRLHAEWRAFCDGRFTGGVFSPHRSRPNPPRVQWPAVHVNDALEDFALMALHQFGGVSGALEHAVGAPLAVRANYGVSILPSLFGVDLFVMDRASNTLPTSWPIQGGTEAIRDRLAVGVPGLRGGLGGRVLDMGRRYAELMAPYPKVRKYVHVYHPDLQGPMDVCEVIWGSGLFYDLVDQPDLVKAFLQLITETYIRFLRAWIAVQPGESAGGYSAHWGILQRGHVMLRDDSAMNLSPAMFEEFVEPYDSQLLAEFGGGAIHFCGRGDHYAPRFPHLKGLHAINLSQPHLNDMEAIFAHTVDRGIAILDLERRAAEEALARGRPLHGLVHSGH